MTPTTFRKTSILAATALSSAALALFAGSATAEPVAPVRVAQDAGGPQTTPPLTPEQKKKFDEWKKNHQRGQQGGPQGGPQDKPQGGAAKPANPPPSAKPATPPVPPKVVSPPKPPAPPAVTKPVVPPPAAAKPVNPPPAAAKPVVPPPAAAKPAVPLAPVAKPAAPPAASMPNPATPFAVNPNQRPANEPARPSANPASGAPMKPSANSPVPTTPFAVNPPQRPAGVPAKPPAVVVKNLEQAKTGRVEKVEAGGNRTVIKEVDKRTIVRQGNKIVIQKDEAAQLQRVAPGALVSQGKLGSKVAVVERPNNVQIITETDRNGQLIRRFRRDGGGNETDILDNRSQKKDHFGRNLAIGLGVGAGIIAGAAILNSVVNVPAPVVNVPREKYVVRYEDASEDDVYEALSAPPMEESDRRYTLNQIRATPQLRDRMRRVDLDDINFETGSWEVDPAEQRKLERIARAMRRVIERNPNEVFLIEGYTDAVGSDVDNLTLSDRRAESVSVILSEQFEVPFENLTTQGYGEQYLKVDTDGPERANRRVAARRITPLLSQRQEAVSAQPRDEPRYEHQRDDDAAQREEDARREEELRQERYRNRHWRRHHHFDDNN